MDTVESETVTQLDGRGYRSCHTHLPSMDLLNWQVKDNVSELKEHLKGYVGLFITSNKVLVTLERDDHLNFKTSLLIICY